MHPYLTNIQTVMALVTNQDLRMHMGKFEDTPAIGKQDNDQFDAYQRWEIKHGQIQEELNGAI